MLKLLPGDALHGLQETLPGRDARGGSAPADDALAVPADPVRPIDHRDVTA